MADPDERVGRVAGVFEKEEMSVGCIVLEKSGECLGKHGIGFGLQNSAPQLWESGRECTQGVKGAGTRSLALYL